MTLLRAHTQTRHAIWRQQCLRPSTL